MNTSNENHDPTQPDDRLIDLALSELIGGNTPPDLSSRIAAATFRQPAAIGQVPRTRQQDRAFWVNLAIAVMLLIGVTFVLLTPFRSARERSHSALANATNTKEVELTAATTAKSKQNSKIVELVDQFNRLNHEQRYAESELVARRLKELAPSDPVAQQVWQNSKFIRREQLNHHVADNKETSTWEQLNSVEESKIEPGSATADRLSNAKDQTRSIVATDSYDLGNAKAQDAAPNPSLPTSSSQSAPKAQAQGPNKPASPAEVPQLTGLYAFTDPALRSQPAQDKFGFDSSGPNQVSGRAWAGGGRNDGLRLYKKNTTIAMSTEAPQVQVAAGDRYGSMDLGITANSTVADLDAELVYDQKRWKDYVPKHEGPSRSGDKYTQIVENAFIKAEGGAAVSTFSIDVDTASYANVRQFLMQMNQLPPPDAVRIEELVNYFKYDYAGPPSAPGSAGGSTTDNAPFAAHVEVTSCPWAPEHRLARIGIKGREMDRSKRPQSNLVFLVDVSGSMNEPAKLPLVMYGLEQLTRELGENDHIAIVVYAGTEGLVLPSTSGSKQDTILAALAKLEAGGSTAGGAGIQLAYQIAEENFIKGGTNRVILCTDGDFNVGVTNTADLQRLVEKKAKDTGVFISTLGFGRGNLNDAMMVAISDHGNGNYHYIDNRTEARRVLVEEMTGTLVTIAKDVKIQVEFNPAQVAGYRLIGYEKRALRTEDFNDDKKDAGEIGAGHTVTALYEIVPANSKVEVAPVDPLKYQQPATEVAGSNDKPAKSTSPSKELLTLKMRYKTPDGDTSKKLEWPITDDGKSFSAASGDLKFAASVAGFGLMLRNSQFKGNLTYAATLELAQSGIGEDPHGYRKEFLDLVRKAKELRHE